MVLAYANEEWTETTEKALKNMNLYPEKARNQFEYVLQWLKNWACVREKGLGTKLPWDDSWVIESLSDSTIYMAYYTVADYLQELKEEQLTESLFDAIFGAGNTKLASEETGINQSTILGWRNEFNYWYPYDLRISGKDLIQNHLSFSLFNHTAMFDSDKWPKGFAVNGWVLVEGEKMSKSKGNFFTMKELNEKYGVVSSLYSIPSSAKTLTLEYAPVGSKISLALDMPEADLFTALDFIISCDAESGTT